MYPEQMDKQLAQCGQASIAYIPPTRRQRLENQRFLLVKQLEVIDKALTALDSHPDLEEFAEALASAGV